MGSFLETTSTLSATLFGMEQYIPGRRHPSDGSHEQKEELSRKEVDSMAGGAWNDGSTMATYSIQLVILACASGR